MGQPTCHPKERASEASWVREQGGHREATRRVVGTSERVMSERGNRETSRLVLTSRFLVVPWLKCHESTAHVYQLPLFSDGSKNFSILRAIKMLHTIFFGQKWCLLVRSLVRSLVRPFTRPSVHSSVRSLVRPPAFSPARSLSSVTESCTHLSSIPWSKITIMSQSEWNKILPRWSRSRHISKKPVTAKTKKWRLLSHLRKNLQKKSPLRSVKCKS